MGARTSNSMRCVCWQAGSGHAFVRPAIHSCATFCLSENMQFIRLVRFPDGFLVPNLGLARYICRCLAEVYVSGL